MNIVELINDRCMSLRGTMFFRLAKKILWVEKYQFFSRCLNGFPPPAMPRMRLKAEFRFGDEEDVRKIGADPDLNGPQNEDCFLQKLKQGDKLVVAELKGKIVFYLWVVTGRKALYQKYLLLKPEEIAIERAFTRKEYRGHGLFLYALNFLFPELVQQGASVCLTEIATHNKPMIRSILRYDFNKCDSCYYLLHNYLATICVPSGSLAKRCFRKSLEPSTSQAA